MDKATISYIVDANARAKYHEAVKAAPIMAKFTRVFLMSESQLTKKVKIEISAR